MDSSHEVRSSEDATFESHLTQEGLLPLPIVIVDDQNAESYGKNLKAKFEDRVVMTYSNLESARRGLLPSSRPFALILDHNMNGNGPVQPGDEVGADLAKQLRHRHPWGLVLPIAYYSRYVNGVEGWVGINKERGWLGATMFYQKLDGNLGPNLLSDEVVPALDEYFLLAGPGYLAAMQTLQQSRYDFERWSFEGATSASND